jgi:hypothetical protein
MLATNSKDLKIFLWAKENTLKGHFSTGPVMWAVLEEKEEGMKDGS